MITQIEEAGLTLAEVVRFASHTQEWTKIGDDEPLTKFYTKFWGKSMADEEQEWIKTQSHDGLDNDAMNNSDADSIDIGEDFNMDDLTTDDTNEDSDPEFMSGCFALDTSGYPFLPIQRIWIRADYLRVYKFTELRYNRCYSSSRAQAMVVTGFPGVGKTVWLLYVLRRRFSEKKPVIWYNGSAGYIFVADGVYRMAPDFQENDFKIFVWTLVDSDLAPDGVPPSLVINCTRLFVIYASSPNQDRWRRLHKNVDDTTVIMNPWTWREMRRAMPILLPGSDIDKADKVFHQLAPTPRVVQLLSDPIRLEEYKRDLDANIKKMTPDDLAKLVRDIGSLSMKNGISNKLGLLRRANRDDVHSCSVIEPITDIIKSRLACQLRRMAKDKQIELYELLLKVKQTRPMAGCLFESIQQGVFQDGLPVDILPMVRLTRKLNAKSRPRWYSSHIPLSNATLNVKRQEALQHVQKIEIQPSETEEFGDDLVDIREGVFYVPQPDNEEALDSFIVIDGILYIFQFTIATNHSIKSGLDFFGKCRGVPSMEQWRFLFVIPPGLTLTWPEPKSLLSKLHPYSAALSIPCQRI